MSTLDQIETLMVDETISDQGYNITRYTAVFSKHMGYRFTIYTVNAYGEVVREGFKSKKDVVKWLRNKGFKICEEYKS